MDVENGVLQGKKLLILAGGPHLVDLVKRAKDLGVYTIVTDYYDAIFSPILLLKKLLLYIILNYS